MTISLTQREYVEQFQEADKEELRPDPLDRQDIIWKSNGELSKGSVRTIYLREGIRLWIERSQSRDSLAIGFPEHKSKLRWRFYLSGTYLGIDCSHHQQISFPVVAGRHLLWGSGLSSPFLEESSHTDPFFEVCIDIQPEMLRSFVSDPSGELPKVFKHLVRPGESECYKRVGETPPMVTTLLQQMIQCRKQGVSKRMILEGITTQIVGLMLEEEAEVQEGEFKTSLLQPDLLDRIYYSKEILLKNLKKSPSLGELAQQAGTCEYNLKLGFKEVFGTTVYGYLRDRRLEKAQQLLLDGQMSVAAVARAVGYKSRSSFYTVFKEKYGVSPKAYQISARK